MKVNLEDFRSIKMLIDQEKNIAIFPVSKTKEPVKDPIVDEYNYMYYPAFFPIELKYPYSNVELAEKIKYGIEQWNIHECYPEHSGKNTYEEKYYGVKGFKKAIQGKLLIWLGWDDIGGKRVSLSAPAKRGYAYYGLTDTRLPDDADWIDFANVVIDYINMDLKQLSSFKTYRSYLNM